MPQLWKGPRLYLDPQRRTWSIRDGEILVRTGCREDQAEKANTRLVRYINKKKQIRIERQIYFVTCKVENFPVKIGMSANVQERLRDIRTALPYEIELLAAMEGTSKHELEIQRRFDHLRIKGEWFSRAPELMEFISSISVPFACQQTESQCE